MQFEQETAASWGPVTPIGPIDYAQIVLKILRIVGIGQKCRMWRAFLNAWGLLVRMGMRIGSRRGGGRRPAPDLCYSHALRMIASP